MFLNHSCDSSKGLPLTFLLFFITWDDIFSSANHFRVRSLFCTIQEHAKKWKSYPIIQNQDRFQHIYIMLFYFLFSYMTNQTWILTIPLIIPIKLLCTVYCNQKPL